MRMEYQEDAAIELGKRIHLTGLSRETLAGRLFGPRIAFCEQESILQPLNRKGGRHLDIQRRWYGY
jgi:hypothetical protein